MDTSKMFLVVGLVSLVLAGAMTYSVLTGESPSSKAQVKDKSGYVAPSEFNFQTSPDKISGQAVVRFEKGGNQNE